MANELSEILWYDRYDTYNVADKSVGKSPRFLRLARKSLKIQDKLNLIPAFPTIDDEISRVKVYYDYFYVYTPFVYFLAK